MSPFPISLNLETWYRSLMLLTNTRYLTSDFELQSADIRIEQTLITEIEQTLEPNAGEEVVDCTDFLLFPALSDCHVHTPDTLFRGLFCDMPLHNWCNDSVQGKLQQQLFEYVDNAVDTPDFPILTLYAYLQYLKAGVACIVETGQADNSSQALEDCAQKIGIKALVDWYDDSPLQDITSPLFARGTHLPEEEDLQEATLQDTIKRVSTTNWPLMTHCLETGFRKEESLRKFGCSTVELLEKHSLLNEKTILFHCIETSEYDRQLLSDSKALLVHCPISNRLSGANAMALTNLLDKKARIALGTDFLTHDMWEVMRATYAELKQSKEADAYDAKTVWKLATTSPCPELYSGRIEIGHRADLLFVKHSLGLSPLVQTKGFSNIAYNTLIHTRADLIDSVMVDGTFVIRAGTCTTVDEEALQTSYQAILQRVYENLTV